MTLDSMSRFDVSSKDITDNSRATSTKPASVVVPRSERVGRLIRRALILFDADQHAAWRYLSMAAALLVDELDGNQATHQVADRSYGLAAWQVRSVVDYIDGNLQSKMDVDQLARLAAVSKGHFSRAFKQRVGLAPMAYVAVRRVERAKTMMASTDESLTAIAIACGFGDQPHLTRWFRRVVGVTPGRYRRINSQLGRAVAVDRDQNPTRPCGLS